MSRVDYRNGMYCGTLNHQMKRQGVGLLITDDSQIVLADWSNDQIHGEYFYNNREVCAFGQMRFGKY